MGKCIIVAIMAANHTIRIGSRVHLYCAVAGDPGCVIGIERGKLKVYWDDLGITTRHAPDALVLAQDRPAVQMELDLVA